MVAGKGILGVGLYPLKDGIAPLPRITSSAKASISALVAPGLIASLTAAFASATTLPASLIRSSSRGDFIVIPLGLPMTSFINCSQKEELYS